MNMYWHVFLVALIHFTIAKFESASETDPHVKKYGNVVHVSAVRNRFLINFYKREFKNEIFSIGLWIQLIQIFRHGDFHRFSTAFLKCNVKFPKNFLHI